MLTRAYDGLRTPGFCLREVLIATLLLKMNRDEQGFLDVAHLSIKWSLFEGTPSINEPRFINLRLTWLISQFKIFHRHLELCHGLMFDQGSLSSFKIWLASKLRFLGSSHAANWPCTGCTLCQNRKVQARFLTRRASKQPQAVQMHVGEMEKLQTKTAKDSHVGHRGSFWFHVGDGLLSYLHPTSSLGLSQVMRHKLDKWSQVLQPKPEAAALDEKKHCIPTFAPENMSQHVLRIAIRL